MVLLYDSDVLYDTPLYDYDGDYISLGILIVRSLLLADLRSSMAAVGDDAAKPALLVNESFVSAPLADNRSPASALTDDSARSVPI